MARKLNPSKLPRHSNGAHETLPPLSRRSSSSVAALYLMQLREQGIKIASSPRRGRVEVEEDIETAAEQPVKIKKID
jgi:hypothetical protein